VDRINKTCLCIFQVKYIHFRCIEGERSSSEGTKDNRFAEIKTRASHTKFKLTCLWWLRSYESYCQGLKELGSGPIVA
jgi:hypothetical protein